MNEFFADLTHSNVAVALTMTTLAGLATGVGSAIAFWAKRTNFRLLAVSLAFSAGVMLYISFVELLGQGVHDLQSHYGIRGAAWLANAGFFGGIIFMALIDLLVPKADNPHELRAENDLENLKPEGHLPAEAEAAQPHPRKLWRTGIVVALAISIHNFPEGMATFFAALNNPVSGLAMVIAVSLHNIPEGISVSVPIFYATGDRRKAFWWSLASGLAEPVGAFIAWMALGWMMPDRFIGLVFAGVAGIMVYVSLDELLPTARQYGKSHEVLAGIVGGMAVMALSLLLLK